VTAPGDAAASARARTVRVVLPAHLRTLAKVRGEIAVRLAPGAQPTAQAVVDALEATFPSLRGTIRDQATHRRRPFLRFYACGEDLSHQPEGTPLPDAVLDGREPFLVVGAMAGG
jgi:molybdopterin synthase sulfur carrier subunit